MKLSVPASLHALLAESVDYAGLFPPAGLPLETALENHSAYVRNNDAWMLGRFVLPVGKLAEAEPLLAGCFDPAHPLRVSVLGSKSASADEFLENLRANLVELTRFGKTHEQNVAADWFETALPLGAVDTTPGLLLQADELIETLVPWQLRVFWEVSFSEHLPATLRQVASYHREGLLIRRGCHANGVKLRTGGIEASAFPTPAQLAGALVTARDHSIGLKFTAGLHHPVWHFGTGLGTHMHGFLNVFAAGILAREHRLDVAETKAILEDERPGSFRFDAEGFAWRERRVPTAALAAHRQFVTSFGSCSFDEPRDDLRRLGLMV